MREIIAKHSTLLKADDWVELRVIKAPEKKINGYTYSYEKRCLGNIVTFLGFKKENGNYSFLLRKEATPCWELDTPVLSSFTGGCDKDLTPKQTFLKELEEEAGYIVEADDERIYELGTSFATKSTDSVYHLFAVNLDAFPEDKIKDLYVETDLEQSSTNEWIEGDKLHEINDPFASQIVIRLFHKLM